MNQDHRVGRRGFLAGVGGAAATLAVSRLGWGQDGAGGEKKVGFAFVGLGGYATRQMMPAVAATRHVRIAALVSGSPEKAKALAKQYGVKESSIYSYENFDTIKDNPDVDVIYVVLPVGMHAEYVVRAAKAGKHVMCEKPMARSVAECQQMIDACRSAGKLLMIGYRCHHEPNNLEAIRIVREKELGELRHVVTEMGFRIGDPKVWRLDKRLAGGGSIYDIGIYGLNACRYLTGEEPSEVLATTWTLPNDPRFATVETSCDFTLKFPSGVIATNSTSYDIAGQNRVRCIMDRGHFVMDPATGYGGIKVNVFGGKKPGDHTQPEINQFAAEMDHLAMAVMTGGKVKSPGEEGLRDLRVIEAAYESAATGRAVRLS